MKLSKKVLREYARLLNLGQSHNQISLFRREPIPYSRVGIRLRLQTSVLSLRDIIRSDNFSGTDDIKNLVAKLLRVVGVATRKLQNGINLLLLNADMHR